MLDVKKVDNVTLRQRITADKQKWLKEGGASVTFGACYYIRLKTLYRGAQDPTAALVVDDAAVPPADPALCSLRDKNDWKKTPQFEVRQWYMYDTGDELPM